MQGTIGEIRGFAGNFAPRNWAFCEGQLLAISSNSALFSVIGTIYGGDGRTTMQLPDLRGRVMIGPGTGPGLPSYTQGHRGGNYQTQLSVANLPAHNHVVDPGYADTPSQISPSNGYPANLGQPVYGGIKNGNMGNATVGMTGSNVAFSNMPPYQAIYWIICLYGTYPSRS